MNSLLCSDHFLWLELACRNRLDTTFQGIPPGQIIAEYPLKWRTTRAVRLATVAEAIRAIWNLSLYLASVYRTPSYNAAVGGASGSQHVQGRAADVHPPLHVSPAELWAAVHQRVLDGAPGFEALGCLIRYDWGIHADCRARRADGSVLFLDYRPGHHDLSAGFTTD
jgi:hypothetical protein